MNAIPIDKDEPIISALPDEGNCLTTESFTAKGPITFTCDTYWNAGPFFPESSRELEAKRNYKLTQVIVRN